MLYCCYIWFYICISACYIFSYYRFVVIGLWVFLFVYGVIILHIDFQPVMIFVKKYFNKFLTFVFICCNFAILFN